MPARADMTRSLRRSRPSGATGAFTLLELVLVVAILASLAGLAVVSVGDVETQATSNIACHELNEVREAILQFRADTGFLPKRGPFNLSARPADNGAVEVPSQGAAWFDAPANLTQLFERPLIPVGHPSHALTSWDPGRRRGWRGPYLARAGGRVRVASGLAPSGVSPWTPGAWLDPFHAVADAYAHPVDAQLGFEWEVAPGGRFGRPIFVFDLDPGAVGPADDHLAGTNLSELARIVSSGPDGRYDLGASGSDDAVLYLLR